MFDVAVVGGGAAGLYVALRAAELGAQVCLISRKPLAEASSYWAQGGLAAALGSDDSPELHATDTLRAGRELCRRSAVELLAREAPNAVRDLERLGVRFDTDPDGALELGLEGGHSNRRVVHAGGSATGRHLMQGLSGLVANETRIELREGVSALALTSDGARCHGVLTDGGDVPARATVLATGGAAALWQRSTNPWGAIGAGMVLAHAAGAELADLEFCQFHPTALALPGDPRDGFLITEAIRGEGATLLDGSGERFTDELAPRDEVTDAILRRMDEEGSSAVRLDLRRVEPDRFPNVIETLRAAGLDPGAEPVPVSPAAHYLMGGVATDLDGRSSVGGLYAVGECACNGLHGANRLASNSLSECFVLGARAAAAALEEPKPQSATPRPEWIFEPPTERTRERLWQAAGPRRDPERLAGLADDPYPLARMIAASALARRESRGPHRRTDFPERDPGLDGTHLVVSADGKIEPRRWE